MRTIVVVTILIILAGAIFLFSFKFKEPATTEASVFRDLTEAHLAKPDAGEIINLYQLNENRWKGTIFRFSNLTDVSINHWKEARIPAENMWLSNEPERDKLVKKFKNDVSSIVANADKDVVGKAYSSVYFPLASELNRLSQSNNQRRILIVYSDLMENELDVSLYPKDVFNLLETNPDSLKSLFEKREMLKDLTGIEIYFIYQPATAEKDREFSIVSSFYKKLFEEKGATVVIKANLD